MGTKLELPTVIRQIQSAAIAPEEKQRLIQKATSSVDERGLLETQNDLFALGGGRVKSMQTKIARVQDTR